MKVVEGQEYKPFAYFSRSVLRVNVTDTANYTCYAINQMVGGRQSSDQRSFMVYVVETSEGKDDEVAGSGSGGDDQGQGRSAVSRGDKAATSSSSSQPKGYCAPYNGQVCKKYLKGRGLVWFNVSQDNSGGWLNEQVTQAIWDELVSGLGEPCRSAAEVRRTEEGLQVAARSRLQGHQGQDLVPLCSPCCANTRFRTAS